MVGTVFKSNENMKTGIVILNYNDYENTLRVVEQVESYFSLSYIIIVDNCSPNKENLKLKELENDRIVFLRADENKGYGSGNNIGLRYLEEHTDCELVIISNPDIEVKEEVILKMQEDMQTNSFISFLLHFKSIPPSPRLCVTCISSKSNHFKNILQKFSNLYLSSSKYLINFSLSSLLFKTLHLTIN